MATENLEYLDESGLNRTAVNVLAKIAEAKAQIKAELDSLDYAQPEGIYPDMTVGAVIGTDETSQWATRESTGSGSATVRSVQGASVVFNQLVAPLVLTETSLGINVNRTSDGRITINGTATGSGGVTSIPTTNVKNHKYLINGHGSSYDGIYFTSQSYGADNGNGAIITNTSENTTWYYVIAVTSGTTYDNVIFRPQIFDLTQMFGSGNEPTTVAEFEQMFPASYYPYSTPTLKPVQIAGIASTDAQGGELDAIEWPTQTLRAAGSVADMLYNDHKETNVGVVDLGTLTWTPYNASTYPNLWYANMSERENSNATTSADTHWEGYPKNALSYRSSWNGIRDNDKSWTIYPVNSSYPKRLWINDSDFAGLTSQQVASQLSGKLAFFELATPTATPISPALPMTYKVQAGGNESIIIPAGEISAAPIITIAEPVNMSTELARIWEAIEALQGSRQTLQSDVRSDLQEITSDLTPIDVTKEVQQTDENREVSE